MTPVAVEYTEEPTKRYYHDPIESKLAYAARVLKTEGRIMKHRGIEFLNDKPATPFTIMVEANRILKRLGLPQITGNPAWKA